MPKFTEAYRKLDGGYEIADNQVECIDFLLERRSAVCSPGTGYGKTLIVCSAIKIMLDACTCPAMAVIVCPVKAVKVFKKELFTKLRFKRSEVGLMTTIETKYNLERDKILIISNTNVEKRLEVFEEISDMGKKFILVIDEAHLLQDTESKIYQNLCVARQLSSAVWSVTATPILNDLDSLYNIVDFTCPGFLGDKKAFERRYLVRHLETIYLKGGRKKKTWVVDGYQNLDELNQRLKPLVIVRQLKYNLKIGSKCVELSDKEMEVYERVSEGIFGDEERNFSRRMHDLQRLVDSSYVDEGIKDLVSEAGVEMTSKENMLLEVLEATIKKRFSVIVYADYIDSVNRIEKVIEEHREKVGVDKIYKINGQIPLEEREKVEESIGDKDTVIITSAGSESINLQRANCVVFYDIPYSVKTIIQVIGRICRRDTKHAFQYVLMLFTKGTIDEYKYILFQDNLKMVKASVGIATDLPLGLIEADRLNVKRLKEQLLWVYKGKKSTEKRKKKRSIKEKLFCSSIEEYGKVAATHNLLVEPVKVEDSNIKWVKDISPTYEEFTRYKEGKIPFTIMRAKYINMLHSDTGIRNLDRIIDKLLEGACSINLVGNTEINNVLKDEILKRFDGRSM